MRHCFTWVGLICVVSVLFSVNASAVTPFADDLPDVRLQDNTGSGFPKLLSPAFDLDDYVIDNDETDDALSWTLDSADAGLVVSVTAFNEVDVMGYNGVGVLSATFEVEDGDTSVDQTVSNIKYSTFFVTEPRLTMDNRLSFQGNGVNVPRFTYVELFDGSGSPIVVPPLADYLTSDLTTNSAYAGATVVWGPVIAHDLTDGLPTEVARGGTPQAVVNILGGLDASVLTPNGKVYLTPTSTLSCAVLVSVPAVLESSTFDRSGDWDGAVFMVAPAKKIDNYTAVAADYTGANLDMNSRFENIPAGANMQVGDSTDANLAFITGGWRLRNIPGYPNGTVTLLDPATVGNWTTSAMPGNPANQFPGATSGNLLQVDVDAASISEGNHFTKLISFNVTPVLPGEVYGLSVNIATDIPANATVDYTENVQIQLQTQAKPDQGFFSVTALSFGNIAAANADDKIVAAIGPPTDGKWRQMYVEQVVPELNQTNDSTQAGGTDAALNLTDKGFIIDLTIRAKQGTPAFKVWIDNFYVYCKGMSDLNAFDANEAADVAGSDLTQPGLLEKGLAYGVTALPAIYDVNGELIDGSFESGDTLAANYWQYASGGKPGIANAYTGNGTAYIDTTAGRFSTAKQSNALVAQLPGMPASGNDGIRVGTRPIALWGKDNSGVPFAGVPDNSGPGYYGVSFWVASDAASVIENPQATVFIQETAPTINQVIYDFIIGPTVIPTRDDDWTQYSFVGAFPNLVQFKAAMKKALVLVDVTALQNRKTLATAFPAPYNTATTAPGADADAKIYLDDFVVHKVRDLAEYWDYSLFD